jgi:hypothetical protein
VAIWLSHAGPVIFDGSNIVPIGQDLTNYFNPAKTECINYAALNTAWGAYDPTNKEYNVGFASGAATVPNKWFVYSFEHKKWWERVPDYYPRSLFKVKDSSGGVYLYAGLATGYMVRVDNSATLAGNPIAHSVETGDFFPSNNPWDISILRNVKVLAKKITEVRNLTITHYPDTTGTGTSLASMPLAYASQGDILRNTQACNLPSWAHRFKFVVTTSADVGGLKLLGWGSQYGLVRKEIRS